MHGFCVWERGGDGGEKAWEMEKSAYIFALCFRDGEEVAVVYYREGYMPRSYNEQVSTIMIFGS